MGKGRGLRVQIYDESTCLPILSENHYYLKDKETNIIVKINKIVTHHAKRDPMGIAKSIDPGQPAQSKLFAIDGFSVY